MEIQEQVVQNQEIPQLTRRQKILQRRDRVGRVYAGQIVCAETYSQMSQFERQFWNKCLRTFRKGGFIFKWQGEDHIVPFMTTDGKYSSIKRLQELQDAQNALEESQQDGGFTISSDEGADVGGQSEDIIEDNVVESINERESETRPTEQPEE